MKRLILLGSLIALLAACSGRSVKESHFSYKNLYQKKYEGAGKGGHFQLTLERGEAYGGSITPDGKYLFFTSNRTGNYDIFMRTLDGVDVIPVVSSATNQTDPSISPDGKYLIYIEDELDPDGDVVMLRIEPDKIAKAYQESELEPLDSSKGKYLTNDKKNRVRSKESNPVWAPNGNLIAFSSNMKSVEGSKFGPGLGAIENIWIMNPSSKSSVRKITDKGGVMPSFSPRSDRLVYVSYQNQGQKGDIYEFDLKSNKQRQITFGPHLDLNPTYGPNGTSITFTRISNDTNKDGRIDRKDNAQIIQVMISPFEEKLIKEPRNIALTMPDQNLFDTRSSSFLNGSIVYAIARGDDINIAVIPNTGEIPKKSNIEKQFEFAQSLKPSFRKRLVKTASKPIGKSKEKKDLELKDDFERTKVDALKEYKYILALDKVEQFFRNSDLYPIYGARKEIEKLRYYTEVGHGNKQKQIQYIHSLVKKGKTFYQLFTDVYVLKYPEGLRHAKSFTALEKSQTLAGYYEKVLSNRRKHFKYYLPQKKEVALRKFKLEYHPSLKNKLKQWKQDQAKLDAEESDAPEKTNEAGKANNAKAKVSELDPVDAFELNQDEKKEFETNYSNQSRVYKNIINYIRQQLADEYLKVGNIEKADKNSKKILNDHPTFFHVSEVLFNLGKSKLDNQIPSEFLYILIPDKEKLDITQSDAGKQASWKFGLTPEIKNKTRRAIFDYCLSKLKGKQAKDIKVLEKKYTAPQYTEINYIINIALANFYANAGNAKDTQEIIDKVESVVPNDTIWMFLLKKAQGLVYEMQGKKNAAYLSYYEALRQYKPKYKYSDIHHFISRTLDYFEKKASDAYLHHDNRAIWDQYKFIGSVFLQLHSQGIERELVSKRALLTFIAINNLALRTVQPNVSELKDNEILKDIRLFYESNIEFARANLNNAFIFAEAHLETQLGIMLHQEYEKDGISGEEKEEVLKLFKAAETDFKWSFFANPYFADSYVMLGWMYQFIDEKRETILDAEENIRDKDQFESIYGKYFPGYLFEENIRIYQKSIAFFKDRVTPQVLVSFKLNIGNNYFLLSNYIKAEEFYEEVKERHKKDFEFENKTQEANFYFHLGKTYYFTGKYAESKKALATTMESYDFLAPLKGSEEEIIHNQEKREKILKYQAIAEEYSHNTKDAIKIYEQILEEQEFAKVKRNQSLIYLEIARLKIGQNKYNESLVDLQTAEKILKGEKVSEPPSYPIKIKWLFSFNLPFYSLKTDDVYVGANRLLYDLPTVNRWQYLHSMRASALEHKQAFQSSLRSLDELLKTSKDDKSTHGRETKLAAHFRKGEIYFKMRDLPESLEAYEKAVKLANKNKDYSSERIGQKNILTIKAIQLEQDIIPRSDKIKKLEKTISNDIEDFSDEYIDHQISQKQKAIEEKNDKLKLTEKEKNIIIYRAKQALYPLTIYAGVFRSYILQLKIQEDLAKTSDHYDQFVARKQSLFNVYSRAEEDFRTPLVNPITNERESAFDLNNNRGMKLAIRTNEARLLQDLQVNKVALRDAKEIHDHNVEFHNRRGIAVSNYRLYQIYHALGEDEKAEKHLTESLHEFEEHSELIKSNQTMFTRISFKAVQKAIRTKKYARAIAFENSKKHHLAWQHIKFQLNFRDEKGEYPSETLAIMYDEYEKLEASWEYYNALIQEKLLRRADTEAEEDRAKAIKEKLDELKKKLLTNTRTNSFAKIMFPKLIQEKQVANFDSSYLYILKAENGFHLLKYEASKKNFRHAKLNITKAEIDKVSDMLLEGLSPIDKINGLEDEIDELEADLDQLEKSDKVNRVRLSENLKAKESELNSLKWSDQLRKLQSTNVFIVNEFRNFPFAKLFKRPISVRHTLTELSLIEANQRISHERLVQIVGKGGLLTHLSGFGTFFNRFKGGTAQEYGFERKNQRVKDLKSWNAIATTGEILDYEAQVDINVNLTEHHLMPVGNVMATYNYPSFGIITYNIGGNSLDEKLLEYMGAMNLLFAARGSSLVLHNFDKRNKKNKKIYQFFKGEPDNNYIVSANPTLLHSILWRQFENPSIKRFTQLRKSLQTMAEVEEDFYYKRALELKEKNNYLFAKQAIDRVISAEKSKKRLLQQIDEAILKIKKDADIEKSSEQTSLKYFNLRNELLYLNKKPKEAQTEYIAYIKSRTKEDKKILKHIWIAAMRRKLKYADKAATYFELKRDYTKYDLKAKDWFNLLDSYYLRSVHEGRLSEIYVKKSEPSLIINNLKKKFPDGYQKRIEFLLKNTKMLSRWGRDLYDSFDLRNAYEVYHKTYKNEDYKRQMHIQFMNGWAKYFLTKQEILAAAIPPEDVRKRETAWESFMIAPTLKKLRQLKKYDTKERWVSFSYGYYYVQEKDYDLALSHYQKALDLTYEKPDFFLADIIFMHIIQIAFKRRLDHTHTMRLIDFLSKNGKNYLGKSQNIQRINFYKLIASLSLVQNKTDKYKEISDSLTLLSSVNESIKLRASYLSATFKPSAYVGIEVKSKYRHRFDKTYANYLNILNKKNIKGVKNRQEFNLLLTYFVQTKDFANALRLVSYYDSDYWPVSLQSSVNASVNGLIRTYPDHFKHFNWRGANITFRTIVETDHEKLSASVQSQKTSYFFMPHRTSLTPLEELHFSNNTLFLNILKSNNALNKLIQPKSLSKDKFTWVQSNGDKNKAHSVLLNIFLGPKNKNKADIELLEIEESKGAMIRVWQNPKTFQEVQATLRNTSGRSINLFSTKVNSEDIYISFLQFFLEELTNRTTVEEKPKNYENETIDQAYVNAKRRLRSLYPEFKDYSSVIMVIN